ncbi:zinc finger C2H2 domain-containing protein [Vairimorpha necatrix]|uniref:Zinc finger C2H2 domain-containing protein n=1 Tax=Vairimorpha necatrix TaxID=6039 RepID=A0AAX4JDS4_9MICR
MVASKDSRSSKFSKSGKKQEQSEDSTCADLSSVESNCEAVFDIKKENYDDSNEISEKVSSHFEKLKSQRHVPDQKNSIRKRKNGPELINSPIAAQQKTNKTGLDYLKEIADQISFESKKKLYKEKSFSPENSITQKIRKLKEDKMNKSNHNIKENSSEVPKNKTNRELIQNKKPKKEGEMDEISENETIKCFADFSDSMFSTRKSKGETMFCCADADCNVELPSMSRIKRHYLVHTDLKPFKCLSKKCTKKFSRKDNMLQHYRMHCKKNRKKD